MHDRIGSKEGRKKVGCHRAINNKKSGSREDSGRVRVRVEWKRVPIISKVVTSTHFSLLANKLGKGFVIKIKFAQPLTTFFWPAE